MAKEKPLKDTEKRFCEQYVIDLNATKAYLQAHPDVKESTAGVEGHKYLKNPKIKEYIKHLQDNLSEATGITKTKVLQEYAKMAFTSIADLHNTWIDRKEFESLTDDQKASIAEIQTRIVKKNIGTKSDPEIVDVEEIKIKLHDKSKALDSIAKMLGFNESDKVEVSGGEGITIVFPKK